MTEQTSTCGFREQQNAVVITEKTSTGGFREQWSAVTNTGGVDINKWFQKTVEYGNQH